MLRTRAAMLAHLQPSPAGVVLPGPVTNAPAVVAAVLNTAVDDLSVVAALRAAQRHQARLHRIQRRPIPLASHDARHTALPDQWLTLHIGIPDRLHAALGARDLDSGSPPTYLERETSSDDPSNSVRSLFGVPLHDPLASSAAIKSVGVAALVLRPDMRTAHLVTMGPWNASTSAPDVLHAMQRLAREYLAQWHLASP